MANLTFPTLCVLGGLLWLLINPDCSLAPNQKQTPPI
jgi:hypothetical protein